MGDPVEDHLSGADAKGRVLGPMGRLLTGVLLGRFVGQTIANIPHNPNGHDLEAVEQALTTASVTSRHQAAATSPPTGGSPFTRITRSRIT